MRKYLIILFVAGFLLYLPSLFGPFVWDDEDFVYANKYVADFRVDKFFTESQTAGRGKVSNYFRPVPQIAYASVHSVFGFNPFWYHLLNVLVHVAAAGAIFYFLILFMDLFLHSNNSAFIVNLSFIISLLFLVHPIQTETVSYISGLSDPLYVLFGFLSLIFFLKRGINIKYYCWSIVFFILSFLSKETGIVFLPLLILAKFTQESTEQYTHDRYDFVLLIKRGYLSFAFRDTLPYIGAIGIYLWYHFSFINQMDMKAAWSNSLYANSIVVRLLTFVQNLYLDVSLLIFPRDLFMERDFSIHIQTQIFNPYFIGFIVVTGFIGLLLFRLRRTPHFPMLIFFFLGFFITLLPYSGVVLINGIFYEHFLYLPMVFFFGFVVLLALASLARGGLARLHKVAWICAVVFLGLLAVRNISRQFDWNDAVRFYKSTLVHAPKSIRIRNGLAMAYADNGDYPDSVREYQTAISLDPKVPNLYHNLANTYLAMGNISAAETNYLKAIEVDPKFIFSWRALANLYQQTGQREKLAALIERSRAYFK